MGHEHFVYRFGTRTYDLSARTHLVGILNVTPDSFSDGGRYFDTDRAVERALQMCEDGASIIDVGGESTRPKSKAYGEGADLVSVEEELRRVLPVISSIARQSDVPISVDTYKSEVASEALAVGATIVNDISGFRFDERMPEVVAGAAASVILMHIKGTPKTMQRNPQYDDVIGEVKDYLQGGISIAERAGIHQIIIDPGLGFGKTVRQNLELISNLHRLKSLGYPILVGASRKNFIGSLLDVPIEERLNGSIGAAVGAVMNGANLVRVHDVKETKQAIIVADAIKNVQRD